MKKRDKLCKFAENILSLMKNNTFFCLLTMLIISVSSAFAEDIIPTINPVAYVTEEGGEETETTSFSGSAPIQVRLVPQTEDLGDCTAYYEWRFYKEGGSVSEPYLVRHEEETEMTLTESGTHCIALIAYFTIGADTIAKYDEEYWQTATPIRITASESKLEFPNAFSPNGDGTNDIYKAKDGYRSIVEFKATIYNRWGQKIYEWTNPAGGWDGKFNGSDVKQGVYFVHVVAKGADGRKYNIKRDVNLLRGYDETSKGVNN